MTAHLRPLPRCKVCGAPATEQLHNTRNAPIAEYCSKHAAKALREFQKEHEAAS